jgi:predicted nucleic acid-binding protein
MLVDTDVLIWVSRNNGKALKEIEAISFPAMSTVTYMEVIYGIRSKVELKQWHSYIKDREFKILPVTEDISNRAQFWMEEYLFTNRLSLPDALIAATAKIHGLDLLTGNYADFHYIKQLSIKAFKP